MRNSITGTCEHVSREVLLYQTFHNVKECTQKMIDHQMLMSKLHLDNQTNKLNAESPEHVPKNNNKVK